MEIFNIDELLKKNNPKFFSADDLEINFITANNPKVLNQHCKYFFFLP